MLDKEADMLELLELPQLMVFRTHAHRTQHTRSTCISHRIHAHATDCMKRLDTWALFHSYVRTQSYVIETTGVCVCVCVRVCVFGEEWFVPCSLRALFLVCI